MFYLLFAANESTSNIPFLSVLFRGPSSRSGFSKITREISTTAESKHVPIT